MILLNDDPSLNTPSKKTPNLKWSVYKAKRLKKLEKKLENKLRTKLNKELKNELIKKLEKKFLKKLKKLKLLKNKLKNVKAAEVRAEYGNDVEADFKMIKGYW